MFKLPDWTRPYVGSVVGAGATILSGFVLNKIPFLAPYINETTVSTTVLTWLAAHAYTTATNVKVNPTQAATPELAKSVPATTTPK